MGLCALGALAVHQDQALRMVVARLGPGRPQGGQRTWRCAGTWFGAAGDGAQLQRCRSVREYMAACDACCPEAVRVEQAVQRTRPHTQLLSLTLGCAVGSTLPAERVPALQGGGANAHPGPPAEACGGPRRRGGGHRGAAGGAQGGGRAGGGHGGAADWRRVGPSLGGGHRYT